VLASAGGLSMRLLLVEDDLKFGAALTQVLQQAGFELRWLRRCAEARTLLAAEPFDALLLDIMLPDGSGVDLLRDLRATDRLPVLMITALDGVPERVTALRLGADDFLVKPFAVEELVARIHAVLRRHAGQAGERWVLGALELRLDTQHVTVDGRAVTLAPREFELLAELARHAGRVVTRTRLEGRLAAGGEPLSSNALDVHVHHLRRKIDPMRIRTLRGIGFLLDA
jgi:DNA-binding response OmpR family regulator